MLRELLELLELRLSMSGALLGIFEFALEDNMLVLEGSVVPIDVVLLCPLVLQ